MSELRLTCLSPEVKALVAKELHHVTDPATREIFAQIVKSVAACPAGQQVGVELMQDHAAAPGKRRRSDRARTPYQEHPSQCMKGGAKTLKECAAEWRRTHPKGR